MLAQDAIRDLPGVVPIWALDVHMPRPDGREQFGFIRMVPATATCTPTVCRRCHPRGGRVEEVAIPAQRGTGGWWAGARLAHRFVNEGESGPRR